jgi:hypothetical protein
MGMEQATGMAPPTRWWSGWRPPPHLSLTNYGCSASRGYAPGTQNADYVGVEEAAGFLTRAECHNSETAFICSEQREQVCGLKFDEAEIFDDDRKFFHA